MPHKRTAIQRQSAQDGSIPDPLRAYLQSLPSDTGSQHADWNNPKRLRRNKSGKTFIAIHVTCKLCGWQRWLAITDALKALGINDDPYTTQPKQRLCRQCAARKGYRITLERYGREYADKRRRLHQINNPPSSERIIAHWLQCLGYEDQTEPIGTIFRLDDTGTAFTPSAQLLNISLPTYERQVRFYADNRCHLIDFVIANYIALSVMGFWHTFDARHQEYDQHFREYWPGPIVEISTTDITNNPDMVLDKLNNLMPYQ